MSSEERFLMTGKLALLLAGILLLNGCSKDDSYEVLSAKEEIRKSNGEDSTATVFMLKHGGTIITARCDHYMGTIENECAALVVGEKYPLKRYRLHSLDMLALQLPERESAVALNVEAENMHQ
jgi:hypothetical protein